MTEQPAGKGDVIPGGSLPSKSLTATDEAALDHLLVETVFDYAIFRLDPRGNIQTWNAGAQRIKGYQANEIIGRHFSTFYTEEDLATHKPERELEIATRTGKYEEEGWRVRKDGSQFWANVVITALRGDHGQLIGFAKITRDLTERRKGEEAARRAEREAAERTAREELMAVVAHDLRNPLHTMLGSVTLIDDLSLS